MPKYNDFELDIQATDVITTKVDERIPYDSYWCTEKTCCGMLCDE